MGKLLNAAIAGSKAAAAAPTFEYASDGVATGTVIVYKNGTIIFNSAAPANITQVTVAAGDTVRMTQSGGIAYLIEYRDNGTLTTYGSDSGTKTLSAGRAYSLYCVVP
jgi:plastocyanin